MIIGTIGAVVGEIMQVKPHPRAQRIWLAYVRLATCQDVVQIVFGGHRELRRGDLVPVAPPGTRVVVKDREKPKKMRTRRYRGEPSHGMLCSLNELGWVADGPDEVAVLQNLELGRSLCDLAVTDRAQFVKNWDKAVETAVAVMVNEVLDPAEKSVPEPVSA